MSAQNLLRAPSAFNLFPRARGSNQRARVLLQAGTFTSSCRIPFPSTSTASSNALPAAEESGVIIKSRRRPSILSPVLLQAGGESLASFSGDDGELEAEGELRDLVVRAGMGMTLTLNDFRAAFLMPKELAAGFLLQYTVMPFSGYFVSKLLKLPSYYAAGLILVACCPGGTASNIVTYLARGNVALSVLMTAASTFASAIMTPFLTSKLAGQFVAVDPAGLFISTVQVVLAPVLIGAVLNQYCNNLVKFVSPVMPFIAVATVAILCGSAIAQSASAILASGVQVVLAVFSLHVSGFFFGYAFAKLLGIDESSTRTISIEVGMQNSVLGVVLASKHFGNPLTAVPCAVSSICHSVCGSALAAV
ncbi:hypothetical protein HPP92_018428 [Vanilla planifolia]|uniref:Uncharacterized protein n=1 Tax=Vanilla planifolia TaxID=51239 RepID=A0A835QDI4_VANPL|nr:hypothetical protein HPP92_018428 [Vanilla planifolia]